MQKLPLLLAFAVIGFAGMAQAAVTSPQGGWTVGPIQAKAQDGRGYCSMKSAYDGGVSLVFARDAVGSNSVAIELPKNQLQAGKQYPVHFTIGPVERQATALAAGTKVLVVQMGADDMFYEMLARKDVLEMTSEAGDFAFGLQGTSKALMALDNCAAAFTSGGRPKSVKVGLPPVFSGLDEGFDAPIVGSQIVTGNGPTVIKVSRPVVDEPLMRDDEGVDSLEIERLKAENRALELENQATAERLKAAELSKLQKDSQIEAAFAERERALEIENRKLQSALAAAKETERTQEELKARLREAEARTRELAAQSAKVASIPVSVAPIKTAGVKDILLRARVAEGGGVIRTAGEAYSWEASGIYGVAEEYPWPEGRGFRDVAQNYISATGEKCAGDFAFTLGDIRKIGVSETAEAEIACIDGKNDAAAALLFVADAGKLVVITYEGSTEQMTTALEKRAAVVSSLK